MGQKEYAGVISGLIAHREPFVQATVVRIEGSSLGKPGFKTVISGNGETLYGSLGGSCPESAIANAAQKALRTGSPKVVKVYMENVENAVDATIVSQTEDEVHVETNCGGMMEVYVEPYLPQQRLFLIGQGGKDDVENALIKFGKALDFEVIVIDHAPLLTEEPDMLVKDLDYDLTKLDIVGADSVVVLTKGERDFEVLEALSKFRPRFIGVVASKQRAIEDAEGLKRRGVPEEFVQIIRAPVGADIGAVTPAEIALSIVSDIVATNHGKRLPQKRQSEKPTVASQKMD
jgi:xanthine dehydrogenase accessory factor